METPTRSLSHGPINIIQTLHRRKFVFAFLIDQKGHEKAQLTLKMAASVLLKLFVNGKERCHSTDAPALPPSA